MEGTDSDGGGSWMKLTPCSALRAAQRDQVPEMWAKNIHTLMTHTAHCSHWVGRLDLLLCDTNFSNRRSVQKFNLTVTVKCVVTGKFPCVEFTGITMYFVAELTDFWTFSLSFF